MKTAPVSCFCCASLLFALLFLSHSCIWHVRMRPEQDGTSTELLVIHTDPDASSPSTPHNNDDDDNKNNSHSQQKQYLSGWRLTLTLASVSCLVVLVLNLGFALWSIRHRSPMEENENENNQDQGVLYEGSCSKVKKLGIGLHFVN